MTTDIAADIKEVLRYAELYAIERLERAHRIGQGWSAGIDTTSKREAVQNALDMKQQVKDVAEYLDQRLADDQP